ncbi:hypothetical protein [Mycolicibacterium pyrenivorans]|uniref:hypothetical protein n=1 Tax=Mycolicibacterium pyrenivorans TaxID=187102 RepID=UPI0021F2CB3F|nr:hypothetical protein [Mycolicibacterium pyrenivorans]MCV7152609.1 hypothetical protein [Mycolicibacterium pyrenivorans]
MTESNYAPEVDSASPLGLQILEELRVLLLECQLVVISLADEVDLNFEDCLGGLTAVRELVAQASGAASLMSQNAALDSSWSTGPSRPKAIYARHTAAVNAGASRLTPNTSLIGTVEARLERLPHSDLSQNYSGSRPGCTGFVAKTGKRCTNTAIYLGAGSFAQHCYSHCTPGERQRYRDHQDRQNQALEDSWLEREELLRLVGRNIIDDWVQNRGQQPPWLIELAEQ